MISFCCAVRDRAANLNRLAGSLAGLRGELELVVADFKSTDNPIVKLAPVVYQVVHVLIDCPYFNRSQGLNLAAEYAGGDKLFFIDVDMLVPADFCRQIDEKVVPGQGWFPICYSLHKDRPPKIRNSSRNPRLANGWWRAEGNGNCGFCRDDFARLGGWDERIGVTYGKEDGELARRCASRMRSARSRCQGLFHMWHPVGAYRTRHHRYLPDYYGHVIQPPRPAVTVHRISWPPSLESAGDTSTTK